MRHAVAVLLVATSAAVAAPVPKALKKQLPDPERFVGKWDVVRTELNGEALGTHAKLWTIDAGLKMKSFHDSGQVLNWTLKLDPAKSPKEIDISSYKGIYEFDGDDLRIAYDTGDGTRPTTFDAKPDVYVETLRRATDTGK
jgi:uncharacterized protein (TIGR03067 family)